MQFLEYLTKTPRRIMKGIPKKCTRPPRIPSVVIRERAVTPNWLLGCTENGFPWQMRWCGPGSDGWGFGLVVSGLLGCWVFTQSFIILWHIHLYRICTAHPYWYNSPHGELNYHSLSSVCVYGYVIVKHGTIFCMCVCALLCICEPQTVATHSNGKCNCFTFW